MTAALILAQYVNLTAELGVGVNGAGLAKYLTSFDVGSLNATEKCADVVACFSVIEDLSEHLDTGNNSLCSLFGKTYDLYFLTGLQLASLNSTCSNGATACDGEYVLNRHKEGLICLSVGSGDVGVNSIHKFLDRSVYGIVRILGIAAESLVCRTLDDGDLIAGELILVECLTDVHLNELEELFIIDLVSLVHEYYD